jgi:predicted nucleotidyltransferase component of viral defense system
LTITRLRYLGPLSYVNSIKLDISFREPVLLAPVQMLAKSPYGDAYPVRVMHVAEIAAEKLRALSMRQAPRDVYDLWVIAGNNLVEAPQVAQLVPHKLSVVGIDLDQAGIDRHLAAVESVWTTDLAGLMAEIPPYPEVRQVLVPWLQQILDAVGS